MVIACSFCTPQYAHSSLICIAAVHLGMAWGRQGKVMNFSIFFFSANYAEHWCSLLRNPNGPFAECHLAIDPSEYYKVL